MKVILLKRSVILIEFGLKVPYMSSIKHKRNKRRAKAPSLLNTEIENNGVEGSNVSLIPKQCDNSIHGSSKSLIKQGLDPEELDQIDKNMPLIKPKLRTEVSPKKILPNGNVKRRINFIRSQTNKKK